jgi:luciferase family oxidoreductase group 1
VTAVTGPRLSILDLAPVVSGSTPRESLRNSRCMAVRADELGYARYWVGEHHNKPGLASSSPAVLASHLAAATTRIRVGTGGVMLPNHAPLAVAEQFGTLEALYPRRIDLGLGRGSGTDSVAAAALRRVAPAAHPDDDFGDQLDELLGYFSGRLPDDHRYRSVKAIPGTGDRPELWLIGSSEESARVAGRFGLPYCYGHHLVPARTDSVVARYRESFRPSPWLDSPHVMLSVVAVAAESDERARWLAGSGWGMLLDLLAGRPDLCLSAEDAAKRVLTPHEVDVVAALADRQLIGGRQAIQRGISELMRCTGADELMLLSLIADPLDAMRSYEHIAEWMRLDGDRSMSQRMVREP